MQQFLSEIATNTQAMNAWFENHAVAGFLVLAWLLTWKGLALWKASQKNDRVWFVAILLINLFSVLEILYYFIFSERKSLQEKKQKSS